MRCMNCGLPLSPARTLTNCPRCGASLNTVQGFQQSPGDQGGWGNMGGSGPMQQENPWVQTGSTTPPHPFPQQGMQNQAGARGSGFQESAFSSRYPYPPQRNQQKKSRNLFMVAGLCVVIAAILLATIAIIIGATNTSNNANNVANTNPSGSTPGAGSSTPQSGASPTVTSADASPTVGTSPTATGTVYPGAQYITNPQMATGVDQQTSQPQQTATTFPVGSNMYVTFQLNPPTAGGAVCANWYLNGTQVTSYSFDVKSTLKASYTYASYGSAGSAYVNLYWASSKSCTDQVLAQQVNFTVTAA